MAVRFTVQPSVKIILPISLQSGSSLAEKTLTLITILRFRMAELGAAFSDVRAVFYEDSLHVTDIEDLVEYLRSLASFKAIIDLPVENIRRILKEHVKDGAIDLPKDYGMFISK